MSTQASDITRASIWEDGDVTEMARFQINGANAVQSDLSTIVRKIYDRAAGDTLVSTENLAVASVVFDTLQTDGRWSRDETGYNFRDRIEAVNFPTGGRTYRVEYLFTGVSGEKFWIIFEHPVQNVLSS